ncbi:hypothetical protein AAY473_035058, partial [Plecturocebus cupreus]
MGPSSLLPPVGLRKSMTGDTEVTAEAEESGECRGYRHGLSRHYQKWRREKQATKVSYFVHAASFMLPASLASLVIIFTAKRKRPLKGAREISASSSGFRSWTHRSEQDFTVSSRVEYSGMLMAHCSFDLPGS